MSNPYPAAYTQQWVPAQAGQPQGPPGFWQQTPLPPPVVVPNYGGGYVPTRKNRNTVNQVKSLLAQCSPGQLLDIAKHASAELRAKNPSLHQELVKAVTGGVVAQKVQTSSAQAGDPSEIARRKAMWKEKCEADPAVAYRDSVIAEIQKQHGTKVAVDDIVCEQSDVDLKRYMKGKKNREVILSSCGLAREGANLVLLPDWVDTSCLDSLNGDGKASDDEGVDFVTKADFLSMQAALIARFEALMGQKPAVAQATAAKPTPGSPPPPQEGKDQTAKR